MGYNCNDGHNPISARQDDFDNQNQLRPNGVLAVLDREMKI
jgi:hypothetical protein